MSSPDNHNGVILINPKFDSNVAAVLRACSCFGITDLQYTGTRFNHGAKARIPREYRKRSYKDVNFRFSHRPFDQISDAIPVAVEVVDNAENLADFEHPDNAVYVFGPENGSIPKVFLRLCHKFVMIPTRHCTNLAGAVYITLYDRVAKEGRGLTSLTNFNRDPIVVRERMATK